MLRYSVSAVLMLVAACVAAPAQATEFLQAIDDLPLCAGLVEQPGAVVFESDRGRVIRATALGQVPPSEIADFYVVTLPALGWKRTGEAASLVFERENETLRLSIRAPQPNQPVSVEFEFIAKLASARLPE